MYKFVAKYTNYETEELVKIYFELDEQFFDNERDLFISVMGKAYDYIATSKQPLSFDSLEFLYC